MENFYAAYGTLMNEERMKTICPDAEFVGAGMIKNHRLMFKGELPFSTATIEEEKGCEVPVIIWKITKANVGALSAEFSRWGSYRIEEVNSLVGAHSAFVAVHVKDEGERLNPPESHYYADIYEAYETHGFDLDALEESLKFSDRRIGWA